MTTARQNSWLENCLTDDERKQFDEQGYLIVEGALDEETNEGLQDAIGRIDSRKRTDDIGPHALVSVRNIIPEDKCFLDLIDWPKTFPKVWGILGWNIYLYHTHLDVTPQTAPGLQGVSWHQDSMRVNDEIESSPRPRLSLKIGYYLTDLTEPGRGNTLIVPGSNMMDEIDCPADGVSNPEGAIPLCVPPGSAVLLDRRTWHSRSPNTSDMPRKVLWYGYSYRWLRPKDPMTVEHLYEQLDPIRRQILGDGSNDGRYDPDPEDVPLHVWLMENQPADAERSLHGQQQSRPPRLGMRSINTGKR